MRDSDEIRSRLNVRDGIEIGECGSFDEAVLWCYRHDSGPIGVLWVDDPGDPDFETSLRFALPHLEDYLRLILREPQAFHIPSYAQTLYARLAAELQRIERHPSGETVWESWLAYVARFRSPDFDPHAREKGISIYPFPPFQIDLEDLVANPPKLRDPRCEYLADEFKRFFPSVTKLAASVRYPSHDDETYKLHGETVIQAMRCFVFSNSAIPSDNRSKWDRLISWEGWATMTLRPRVVGEEF
jgi:hypothetical protein